MGAEVYRRAARAMVCRNDRDGTVFSRSAVLVGRSSWAILRTLPKKAQPQPPAFCFVISEPGDADKPLSFGYVVIRQYRER